MIKKLGAYTKILSEMAPYLKEVEEAITANLQSKSELIKTIDHYVIKSGGKRFRPMLMIITARMCGYEGGNFASLGTVIEYLHSATLLHDDVLDGAQLRRGNPSANKRWGNAAAVLSGDFLFSQAFTLLVENYSKEITLLMLQAAKDMIDGEVLELAGRRRLDLSEEDYYKVIGLKTASLISSSCKAGALLGGAAPDRSDLMCRFGYNLGMAFQIIDDVLDYTGDPKRFGKTPGGDLKEGTITLPLIRLLGKEVDSGNLRLKNIVASENISQGNIEQVIRMIRENNIDQEVYSEALSFVDEGRKILKSFDDGPYRRMLETAADYVISRRV